MSPLLRIAALSCLALGFAGCTLPGTGESVADCQRGFAEGFASNLPPEYEPYVSEEKVEQAARGICAELIARSLDETSSEEELGEAIIQVLQDKPSLYGPVCSAIVEADLAANRELLRFVTKKELKRYRTRYCRVVVGYLTPGGAGVDFAALVRDHSDLLVPFCAAGMQLELSATPGLDLTAKQLRTVSRRTCAEALETGAVNVSGPGGFLDPQVDEEAIATIFFKHVQNVSPR